MSTAGPGDGAGTRPVQPHPEAWEMADHILRDREELVTILHETVEAAENGQVKESGRTYCPRSDAVLGPAERFPKAVELQECPRGAAGVVHTHVAPSELHNPEHSLPDMANVIFSDITASVVLGTQTSDVMLAPADVEPAAAGFSDALGVQVDGPRDVVKALKRGDIPDPPDARARVRARLSSLFNTVSTSFPDIDQRIRSLADGDDTDMLTAAPRAHGTIACAAHYGTGSGGVTAHSHASETLERGCQRIEADMAATGPHVAGTYEQITEGISLRRQIVTATIGAIVAIYVNKALDSD